MMVKLVNCHICGQPFIARSPNSKYCPACHNEAKRRENAKKNKQRQAKFASMRKKTKQKKETAQKPEPKQKKQSPAIKTVDEYCIGCVYLMRSGDRSLNACDYIGAAGRRRPCPAGKGCTERKEG